MKSRKVLFALVLALVLCMSVSAALASNFKVGSETYTTIQAALDAVMANKGNTITMLKDSMGGALFVPANKNLNLTIDFGGFTYTLQDPAAGSAGTQTQGMHIEKNNTVVLKNGTLKVDPAYRKSYAMLIQNYANLTLENMCLDGTYLDRGYTEKNYQYSYTVSNNSGTVNVTGKTDIIANDESDNDIAISADQYSSYPEPILNINTTGTISGPVIQTTTEDGKGIKVQAGTFTDNDVFLYVDEFTTIAIVSKDQNGTDLKFAVGASSIVDAITEGCFMEVIGDVNITSDVSFNIANVGGGKVVVNNTVIPTAAYGQNGFSFTAITVSAPSLKNRAPQTGDESNIVLWAAMMALSAAAFVVLSKKARFN